MFVWQMSELFKKYPSTKNLLVTVCRSASMLGTKIVNQNKHNKKNKTLSMMDFLIKFKRLQRVELATTNGRLPFVNDEKKMWLRQMKLCFVSVSAASMFLTKLTRLIEFLQSTHSVPFCSVRPMIFIFNFKERLISFIFVTDYKMFIINCLISAIRRRRFKYLHSLHVLVNFLIFNVIISINSNTHRET